MTDIHSKQVRSYNMSRVKSKDTKPELLVRRFLHSQGFRYRLNVKDLPGKPDIVLVKHKTVIFVNGCFWHGHVGCKYSALPKTRIEWWSSKIKNNIIRDGEQSLKLIKRGWKVIVLWSCSLKKESRDIQLTLLKKEILIP